MVLHPTICKLPVVFHPIWYVWHMTRRVNKILVMEHSPFVFCHASSPSPRMGMHLRSDAWAALPCSLPPDSFFANPGRRR